MATRRKNSKVVGATYVGRNNRVGSGAGPQLSVISFRSTSMLNRMAEQDNQEIDRALETLRRLGQN